MVPSILSETRFLFPDNGQEKGVVYYGSFHHTETMFPFQTNGRAERKLLVVYGSLHPIKDEVSIPD
jgi:hypothetical protein